MHYSSVSSLQHTLLREVACAGVGLHSGVAVELVLGPAPVGSGVRFVRTDIAGNNEILAHVANVTTTRLGTTIANISGASVATIEHLMAALMAMGVDNVYVYINGPEVPIMDGSSAIFVELIEDAGIVSQAAPRRVIEILAPIVVEDGAKSVRLLPLADGMPKGLNLDVTVRFSTGAIGTQRCVIHVNDISFADDMADARTFGFLAEVETMKAMGLGRGGSLDNAIVIDGDDILNPEGLRHADEFARHKALDAIGDLALAGAPISGLYVGDQGGHGLNTALVEALMANRGAWRYNLLPAQMPFMAVSGL